MRISDWSSDVCSSDLLQQAKQAVLLDPYSANAQMAAASAAFVSGNCILGKAQGLRAVELNLYEPEIYARLGLMLFQCRDPDNEHYLTLAREMLPTDRQSTRLNSSH